MVYTFTRALPTLAPNALTPVSAALELSGSVVRFSGKVAFRNDPTVGIVGVPVTITPAAPVDGWNGCDVVTLRHQTPVRNPATETDDKTMEGSFVCDVAFTRTTPFTATVQIKGQTVGTVVTVEPAGRGVGDVIPVIANLAVPSGLLRVEGVVKSAAGQVVPNALVKLDSPNALGTAQARTDATGRYSATLALRSDVRQTTVSYGVSFGTATKSGTLAVTDLSVRNVNVRTQNMVLSGGKLAFTGRVINRLAPGVPLNGSITIKTNEGTLCTVNLAVGTYACSALIDAGARTSLSVRYEASGDWGSTGFWVQVPELPALGQERTVVRDVTITASTLRLRGLVRSPSNVPLVGATVRATLAGTTHFVETKTGADGRYELRVTLAQGATAQVVDYSVSYRSAIMTDSATTNVTQNAETTLVRDFTYGYRTVAWSGTVTNPYNATLPATTIQISAPGLQAPCQTQTIADGSYLCVAQTTSTAPFTASYVLRGVWGSRTFTQTVALRPADDTTTHHARFTVSPTAARVRGKATAPNGTPLAGVTVTARGGSAYHSTSATTGIDGSYDLVVVLNTPTNTISDTAAFSATLDMSAGYGSAAAQRVAKFDARANTLVDVNADWVIESRTIQFRGTVNNALLGGNAAPLRGTRVVVSSPTLGTLCEWNSASRSAVPTYACDAQVTTDADFDVSYRLIGDWGTETITGTVNIVPAPGQVATVNRDLSVSPTTLQLTGRVLDRRGAAIPGTVVAIKSAQFVENSSTVTGPDGTFKVNVIVRAGVTAANVDYTVTPNGVEPDRRLVSVPLTANQLNTHAQNWTFTTARRIILSGKVLNTTDAATMLQGTLRIVSPTTNEELCATSFSSGTYSCTALVSTDDAFALNYRMDAPWGGMTLLNQAVPAGASTFTKDLAAAPRVVRLVGTVRTVDGTPLNGARVTIASGAFVNQSLAGTTGADGAYSGSMAVREGVSSGTIDYSVVVNGNEVVAQAPFAFAGTAKLATVTQPLVVRARTFTFTGDLVNTLFPNQRIWPHTRVVIRSPQHGMLCETYTGSTYQCSTTLDTAAPFDLVYEVSGAWGRTTISDRVTTIPASGGATTITRALSLTPTMLRLVGRAVDARTMPLESVSVSAQSPAVVGTVKREPSGADGQYEVIVMLNEFSGTQSGQLEVVAQFRSATVAIEVPYTAQAGKLTTINVDTAAEPFQFQRRTVVVRGTIRNSLAPDVEAARPRATITMRAPDGSDWCAPANNTTYSCTISLYDDQPIVVRVAATGEWGAAERTVTVDAIPEPVQSTEVVADLEATAATLRLAGKVMLPNQNGLKDATVRVDLLVDDIAVQSVTTKTKADGTYETFLLAPAVSRVGKLRYSVTYEGIESGFATDGFAIEPNKLRDVAQNFTFEQRRVRFSGVLTNSINGTPLSGRVTLTSPDFYTASYCFANVAANGTWSCDALLRSSEPFTVTYRFTGPWGSKDVVGRVDDIPAAGGTSEVRQDAQAPATIVVLRGTIADRSGKLLEGAKVTVNGTGVQVPATATTNAQGQYSASVTLAANTTSGSFGYAITYGKATQTETHAFTGINPNVSQTVERSFEISSRELRFNGQVTHQRLAGVPQAGRLRVSIGNTQLCEATIDPQGGYLCSVSGVTTAESTLAYTVFGDWGSQKITATLGAGDSGTTATVTRFLQVLPTTLLLKGAVRTPANVPLAGVEIRVEGDAISSTTPELTVVTGADGSYELPVILRDGKLTGTLSYKLRSGNVLGRIEVPYTAVANEWTTIIRDVPFVSRRLDFAGTVRNIYAPSMVLANAKVEVYAPDLGLLCEATTDEEGAYACDVQVLHTAAFRVEYTTISAWGRTVYGGTVEAGSEGAATVVAKHLLAQPTTLHLQGTITGTNGQPLANAQVQVSSPNLIGTPTVTTSAAGRYDLNVLAPAGVGFAVVRYRTSQGATVLDYTYGQTFTRGGSTEVARDFTFAKRVFHLSGKVTNQYTPNAQLRYSAVVITSPTHGNLCASYTDSNNLYDCRVEINTTTPISLEYRMAGDWGSKTITRTTGATLPPIEQEADVVRDITIAPTTLVITGTVKDAAGTPLQAATVSVITNTLVSGLNQNLHAQTDATGTYTLPVVLMEGASVATINMTVARSGVNLSGSTTYTIESNQSATVRKDWTVVSRRLTFNGTIRDSREQTFGVPSRKVTVASPTLGQLCVWTSSGATGYTCAADVASTAAFSVTYTVEGDWGTSVFTESAPAGAWGDATDITRSLRPTPTILRLTGKLQNGTGSLLANQNVRVSSAAFLSSYSSNELTIQTNAQGAFSLLVVLRDNVTEGTITYRAGEGAASYAASRTFTATAREITSVDQTITAQTRTINFGGTIRNALQPTMPVGAVEVAVKTPEGDQLCRWLASDYYGVSPTFFCTAQVGNTDAFNVVYVVSGDWGEQEIGGLVPAGATGSSTSPGGTFQVTATTLRLRGRVTAPNGVAVVGATVAVDSEALSSGSASYQRQGSTNADGDYDFSVVLRKDIPTGSLAYSIALGTAEVEATGTFNAAANTITTVDQNLQFAARSVSFQASIRHALIPERAITSSGMVVKDKDQRTICTWSPLNPSTYADCRGQVGTTDPVTATLLVNGAFGSESLTYRIPAGEWASSTQVNQTLYISPTVVRLYGDITNGVDALDDAVVQVTGDDVVDSVLTRTVNGHYETLFLLHGRPSSSNITINVQYRSAQQQTTRALTSLVATDINDVAQDFTFTSRRVAFSGAIVAAQNTSVAIPARVEISSPVLGQPCVYPSAAQSGFVTTYTCTAEVLTQSAFPVTYTVKADWGTTIITATVGAGTAGSQTPVVRQLPVNAALVEAKGTLFDIDGNALKDGYVLAKSEGFSAVHPRDRGDWIKLDADTAGNYQGFIALKQGVTGGTIDFSAQYESAGELAAMPFTVAPQGVTTITKAFVLKDRSLYFEGDFVNAYGGAGVVATSYAVRSPQLGLLCESSQYSNGDDYFCRGDFQATAPFSYTVTVTGTWGTETITRSVTTLPPVGRVQYMSADLELHPTTLRLHGTVLRNGTPVKDARVSFTDDFFATNGGAPYAISAADGSYEVHALLKAGITSGTVHYNTLLGEATQTLEVPFTAPASQLTTIQRTIDFTQRHIVFSGGITNLTVPSEYGLASRVVVRSPQRGTLCEWSRTYEDDNYGCAIDTDDTTPFDVTYTVSGGWGSTVVTRAASVTPPAAGASLVVDQELGTRPTMLRLQGRMLNGDITDPAQAGIADETIYVYNGDSINSPYAVQYIETDSTGHYDAYVVLKQNVTAGLLRYSMRPGSAIVEEMVPFNATATTLTTLTRDFTITQRRVVLAGEIVNHFGPDSSVPITDISITTNGTEAYCSDPRSEDSSYQCYIEADSKAALNVTYTVTGTWGSAVVGPYTISDMPGATETTYVSHDIAVSPTTVHWSGVVRGPDGEPLSDAVVYAESPAFSGETEWCDQPCVPFVRRGVETDADGTYDLYAPIRTTELTGTVQFRVQYRSASMDMPPVTLSGLTLGAVTEQARDFVFTQREVYFSGSMRNFFREETLVQAEAITVTDNLGTVLCTAGHTSDFSCYGHTANLGAFNATITVAGAWGTTTKTVNVPADEVGASTDVDADVVVKPATIKLTGTITMANNTAFPGGQVYVTGPDLLGDQYITIPSSANGAYEVYVPVANVDTGTLTVTTYFNFPSVKTTTASFSATNGTLTEVQHNVVFDVRAVDFEGVVRNALRSSPSLYVDRVEVTALGKGTICASNNTYTTSSYFCRAMLTTLGSFNATLTVSGQWGSRSFDVAIPAGTLGSWTRLNANRDVEPTMIHVTGTVKRNGAPVSSGFLDLDSEAMVFGEAGSSSITSEGTFDVYAVLRDGVSGGTITYTIYTNGGQTTASLPFTAPTAQAINGVTHEITLP